LSWATVVQLESDRGFQWETLVGAGALLLGVILTGLWADRRQSQALRAERERLDRQLVSERDRLASQHDHDRRLADLAEFRSLIDVAAEGLTQVHQAALKVVVAQQQLEGRDSDIEPKKLRQRVSNFVGLVNQAHGMSHRIALRVGRDHELVSMHSSAVSALQTALKENASESDLSSDALAAQHRALTAFGTQRKAFLDAARGFVASRLPPARDGSRP
jgi:hypothetical protein